MLKIVIHLFKIGMMLHNMFKHKKMNNQQQQINIIIQHHVHHHIELIQTIINIRYNIYDC